MDTAEGHNVHSKHKSYEAYTYKKEMAELDELSCTLASLKDKLDDITVKALLLNVDVVTQFDPYLEESYKGMIEECEACTARMQRRREDKSLQPDTQAPAQTTDNTRRYLLHVAARKTRELRAYSSGNMKGALKNHLSKVVERFKALELKLTTPDVQLSEEEQRNIRKALNEMEPVVELIRQYRCKEQELEELQLMMSEPSLRETARKEVESSQQEMEDIQASIMRTLLPRDPDDDNDAILENYSAFRRWEFEVLSVDTSDGGGYRHASAALSGTGVFGRMKHESGVHRVQRVPATETQGRLHTSTMTVVTLPQPLKIDASLNPNDIKVETFRAAGAGGQHVNTTDSAVRLTHLPTGITVSMQDERSQHKNRAKGMKILCARVYDSKKRVVDEQLTAERKRQIGTAERSERIRTYNYPQDRVTDHRLGLTVYGVSKFLVGTEMLDSVTSALKAEEEASSLATLLQSMEQR
ncbi:hypothetical protein EMCRGX_G029459 [Ephydatia muelleri]